MTIARFTRIGIAIVSLLLCVSYAIGRTNNTSKSDSAKSRHFYLKGSVKEAEGKLDEAYEYYKKAYLTDPTNKNAAFSYGLGRFRLNEDTFASRSEMLRNLGMMLPMIEAYPSDIDAAESYAYFAMQADTFPEALRIYDYLVKSHPGLSRLYVPQSFLYMSIDSIDLALNAIREYERLEGASSETTMRKASFYLAKDDTIGAINEFKAYADANPEDADALTDLAMVYNLLNRQDTAFILLQDIVERFPDNGELKFDLAMMYLDRGDTAAFHQNMLESLMMEDIPDQYRIDMLRQYLEKIPSGLADYSGSDRIFDYIEKEHGDERMYLTLITSYQMLKGDYDSAFKYSEKVLEIEPTNEYSLGRAMSMAALAGKPEKAMELFENFPDKEARKEYSLGLTYMSVAEVAKKYSKAIAWADTMLQQYIPELSVWDKEISLDSLRNYDESDINMASDIYALTADVFASMDSIDSAVRNYENSLALNPDNTSTLNNYSYYLLETVKVEPGTPEFTTAKEMSYRSLEKPLYGEVSYNNYDTYAWFLFKEQNYKDALNYIELALEAAGDYEVAELFAHYGDILFMNGKPEEALKQWEKALTLDPENKVLRKKVEHKTFFYE